MSSPVIPETPAEPAPATNPPINPLKAELDELQRGALSSLHSRLEEERRRNAELEARLNSNANPTPKPTGADFLNDPIPLIQAELQKSVKPLVDFVEQMQASTRYTEAKAKLKAQYPTLGAKFAELEPYIDGYMRGIEPTTENIQAVFTQVIGLQQLGQIPNTPTPAPNAPIPASVPNNPTPANNPMIPPVVPPSPPGLPNRDNNPNTPAALMKAKVDAMTEDERKIARIWGQTPEQFVEYRDASTVVSEWKDIK